MPFLYWVSVTLHVLAALLWLGGMFFLAAVGAPVLRRIEPPTLRAELFRVLGEQFRRVGGVAIAVLVFTGVGNLYYRGLLHGSVLGNPQFWASRWGHALAWKLGCVVVMIALSAVHDFWIGPAVARQPAGSDGARRYRRGAAWIARVEAIVGIVLVVAAVRLARGG